MAFDATTSSGGSVWIQGVQCDSYPEPIAEYGWDWSDLTPPGSGPTPTHTFALAGDYTVTLTVITSFVGLSDSESKLVTVVPVPPPEPQPQIKPQPQPQFTRTLGIGYSERKDRFGGKLTSESPACTSSQKVSVFKKRKGNDPKLGSATTNANGKYSLKKKKADGKFYAKIDQSSTSGGTCLAAQSKTIKAG